MTSSLGASLARQSSSDGGSTASTTRFHARQSSFVGEALSYKQDPPKPAMMAGDQEASFILKIVLPPKRQLSLILIQSHDPACPECQQKGSLAFSLEEILSYANLFHNVVGLLVNSSILIYRGRRKRNTDFIGYILYGTRRFTLLLPVL